MYSLESEIAMGKQAAQQIEATSNWWMIRSWSST